MNVDNSLPPHGGQLHRIAERFGIYASSLLDFSANINPDGPPPSVFKALQEALADPATLSQYPDLEEAQLRRSIAEHLKVVPEAIVVSNGFAPLLEGVLKALPIRRCLLPVPSFGEYRTVLQRARVVVTPSVLNVEEGFHYSVESLLTMLIAGRHDAILLANPQNPSGVLCDYASLLYFIEEASKRNAYILLDEAFIDYAPACSMVDQIERFPNLIIFRSVTKFYGIPGMRVAYSVASRVSVPGIWQNLSPWAVTTLASIAARTALADTVYAKHALQINRERKERLVEQIEQVGLSTYPAAANFVLLRFPTAAKAEACWERLIIDYGFVLRHCGTFEGMTHNHLRCAVRKGEQNNRLIDALKQ